MRGCVVAQGTLAEEKALGSLQSLMQTTKLAVTVTPFLVPSCEALFTPRGSHPSLCPQPLATRLN